ncbi:YceI family protein [Kiloniella majae]|uniref:YceI family protein n=1 Tax=Kiloniella majae TaxID=1938558 RepID=UPI000A277F03|nr:YceI family protein [Kiloniella majae]
MKIRHILITSITFFLISCGSLIPSNHQQTQVSEWREGAYQLDPDHASLIFSLNHLGFSDYYGRFNTIEASLDFDPQTPETTKLFAKVDVTSLDVNNEDFEAELSGRSWFDSKNHPFAYLESTKIIPVSDTEVEMKGNLTLKGITAPISMTIKFNGGAVNFLTGKYTLGFFATGTIKRSDYNISDLVPAIGDEVTLQISAEFLRDNT